MIRKISLLKKSDTFLDKQTKKKKKKKKNKNKNKNKKNYSNCWFIFHFD